MTYTTTYRVLTDEAREYFALCAEAHRLGVPTALTDPRSPRTVAALAAAVADALASEARS